MRMKPGVSGLLVAAIALAAIAATAAAAAPDGPGELPLLTEPSLPAPPRSAAADAATYARCMTLARDNPAAAQRLAAGWQKRGGAHPADHCFAVALIGLGRYGEAAGRLDKLAEAMVHAPAGLRGGVLEQAAQAWLLAGDPTHAYADDGAALGLHPDDAELLVDRAEAAGAAGWFDKAIADLDRVLQADPMRLDALIYRASAYRELGQLAPALADVDTALRQAPDSVPALLERGNIRRLHGDTRGARRDWQLVAALAPPASSAAIAAKANIARLDALGEATPAPPPPGGSR
jgi:tetratricopeptide (TPR) repeat protein